MNLHKQADSVYKKATNQETIPHLPLQKGALSGKQGIV